MSTISASTLTTTALVYTADTTGALVFQTGATPTTALTLNADQSATFAGAVSFATASFTNLSYTGTLTGGTGVVNLGSGQFYKDSSGNVGIGITPSAWNAGGYTALEIKSAGNAIYSAQNDVWFNQNAYYNTSWKYGTTAAVAAYNLNAGSHFWKIASSGTAGNAITFTTAMTLDNSGNLGIGATSGGSRLQVTKTGAPSVLAITSDTTNSGLSITDGTINGVLYSSGLGGVALFATSAHPLIFGTSNTERMRIDSSGNVGINCTPSAWNSSFKALQISGYLSVWSANSSNQFIYANAYYSNSADTYYANGYAQRIIMSSNGGGYTFADSASGTAGGTIAWVTTLALSKDKTVALQGASQSTGTGISFPATQSASSNANTLDDYEEGTWTPQLGSDTTQPTVSYSSQSGYYTKIGSLVTVEFCVGWTSNTGGTGGATVKNLPFASGYSTVDARGFTYMFTWGGPTYTGVLALIPDSSNTRALIYFNNNGSISSQPIASMASSGNIRCIFSYSVI